MFKKILSLTAILSLTLMVAACGKNKTSVSVSASDSTVSSTSETTSVVSTETSASVSEEVVVVSKETSVEEAVVPEGSVKDMLDAFIAGTEKAVITKAGDKASYYSFTGAMTEGEAYTLDEIISNLSDFITANGWEKAPTLGEITHEYIDCGSDGKPELLVSIELPIENIEPFRVDMVIAEKGGKLVVAFDGDSWSRSETMVDGTGYIVTSGSAGAAVMAYSFAFVDGNGDYQFACMGEDVFAVDAGTLYVGFTSGVTVELSGLDTDYLSVEFMSFVEDPKSSDIYAVLTCSSEAEGSDAYYADGNPIKAAFEAAGLKVVTSEQLIELSSERLKALGYN